MTGGLSERGGEGQVSSRVSRDLTAYSARADEPGTVAAVARCHTKVRDREAHARIVVVQLGGAVIPHVAGEHAPVRCQVELQQPRHPVALVILGRQVLKFHAGRNSRGPFVQQVSYHNVGQTDVKTVVLMVLVIFLRRVQKSLESRKTVDGLDLLLVYCPCVDFDIFKAAVPEKVGDDTNVSTVLKDIGCERMSGAVPGDVLGNARFFCPGSQSLQASRVTWKDK